MGGKKKAEEPDEVNASGAEETVNAWMAEERMDAVSCPRAMQSSKGVETRHIILRNFRGWALTEGAIVEDIKAGQTKIEWA